MGGPTYGYTYWYVNPKTEIWNFVTHEIFYYENERFFEIAVDRSETKQPILQDRLNYINFK